MHKNGSADALTDLEAGLFADRPHLRQHVVLRGLACAQLLVVIWGSRHRRPALPCQALTQHRERTAFSTSLTLQRSLHKMLGTTLAKPFVHDAAGVPRMNS
jgi:hypothetical protein